MDPSFPPLPSPLVQGVTFTRFGGRVLMPYASISQIAIRINYRFPRVHRLSGRPFPVSGFRLRDRIHEWTCDGEYEGKKQAGLVDGGHNRFMNESVFLLHATEPFEHHT